MRCLNGEESAEWLRRHGLPPAPYDAPGEHDLQHYLQFYPPTRLRAAEEFTNRLLHLTETTDEVLISVMNTIYHEDFELRLFDRLRPAGEENVWERPGNLFSRDELRDASTMLSLTAAFEWSVYMHMPQTRSILYNWEGTIFDFWTSDPAIHQAVLEMLAVFELGQTEKDRRP
jgi:hypothetical protein